MDQERALIPFDFGIMTADKRERAIELDAQCGEAIVRLSYAVDDIGRICLEMRKLLPHGFFRKWAHSRGLTDRQVTYAMDSVTTHTQEALGMIENVQNVHFENELFSLPERADSMHDDKETSEQIAQAQREKQEALERAKSLEWQLQTVQEQAKRFELQLAHMQGAQRIADEQDKGHYEAKIKELEQRLLSFQGQTRELQKNLQQERANRPVQIVEKPVTPPEVMRQLQEQEELIKRLRKRGDHYERELQKERKGDNERFLQGLEPMGVTRMRARFNEEMQRVCAGCMAWMMHLPGIAADARVFEEEEWQRLEEARRALVQYIHLLDSLKQQVTMGEAESLTVIDAN